jgi:hypothetical protein
MSDEKMGGTASTSSTITIQLGAFKMAPVPRLIRQNKSLGNVKVSRTDLIRAVGELVDLLVAEGWEPKDMAHYEQMIIDAQFNNPCDLAIPSWWNDMQIHAVSIDGEGVEDGKPWLWATLQAPPTEERAAANATSAKDAP